MKRRGRQRRGQIRRRAFHAAIALVLIICAVSPFLESAVNWNDTVFATGYDTETTVAILMLLLELVFSLTNLLTSLCRTTQLDTPLILKDSFPAPESAFGVGIPELSPPLPLRI